MTRGWKWAGGIAAGVTAGLAGLEWYGRAKYRQDQKRPVSCDGDSHFTLRDGRTISYLDRGDPNGTPILYLHGALGSRLEFPRHPELLDELGLRLIAPDRPGCGCSTPVPKRKLLDYPDEVRELLDGLGIHKFRVIAWSAGTGYGMAVAVKMPERVSRLDLIGAIVPETYPEGKDKRDPDLADYAKLAQLVPGIAYAGLRHTVLKREKDPLWFEERMRRSLCEIDKVVTRSKDLEPLLMRAHAAGESRIAVGVVGDLETLGGDWGFWPREVTAPVTMWQGTHDRLTPAERNERLTREFPNVQLKMFPNEGHFLIYKHEREILES